MKKPKPHHKRKKPQSKRKKQQSLRQAVYKRADESKLSLAERMEIARQHYENKDWSKVIEKCDAMIEDFVDEPQIYITRGITHENLGNFEIALDDLYKALELFKNQNSGGSQIIRALQICSDIHIKQRNPNEAIRSLKESINLYEKDKPTDIDISYTYYAMGLAYIEKEDFKKAQKNLTCAIKLSTGQDESAANAHALLGIAYAKLGETNDAIREIDNAIRIYPEKSFKLMNTHMLRADVSSSAELHDEARESLECAEKLLNEGSFFDNTNKENEFKFFNTLGNIYFSIKILDKALQKFSKALTLCNDNQAQSADAYYNIGRTHFEIQNFQEALDAYQHSIDYFQCVIGSDAAADDIKNAQDTISILYAFRSSAFAEIGKWKEARSEIEKLNNPMETEGLRAWMSKLEFQGFFSIWLHYECIKVEIIPSHMLSIIYPIRDAVFSILKEALCESAELAHYTSLHALQSLIGLPSERNEFKEWSGFRLYDVLRTNDPNEGDALLDVLDPGICTKFSLNDPTPNTPVMCIGSFVMVGDEKPRRDDALTLWRFYGKTDSIEATGCSVIFKKENFSSKLTGTHFNPEYLSAVKSRGDAGNLYKQIAANQSPDIARALRPQTHPLESVIEKSGTPPLLQITYLDKNEETPEQITKIENSLREINIPSDENEEKLIKNTVQLLINTIRFLYKSDQYKDEGEARIIWAIPQEIIKIDMGRGANHPPRHYFELPSDCLIPSRIILGPKVDEGWENFLTHYLSDKNIEVKKSKIPFKPN